MSDATRVPSRRRWDSLIRPLVSVGLSAACVAALLAIGYTAGWEMPKASALAGFAEDDKDDWCEEHAVPKSECVECNAELMPKPEPRGWCRIHGVHECPHCYPTLAELAVTGEPYRPDAALGFASRPENNSKCQLNRRRIQIASVESWERLGVGVAPVGFGAVEEMVTTPAVVGRDLTRVARLSARTPGTVWRVEKKLGDAVKAGDVLALIDSAEVGRAKAEFQQAVVQLDLRTKTLAALQGSPGVVPGKELNAAGVAVEEARVRLALARQTLLNLGLTPPADADSMSATALAERMRFLGVPEPIARELAGQTLSANLIPLVAPSDGEVIERTAATGGWADPSAPLFVVADTSRVWLTLNVRPDDADRIRPGQPIRFRHPGQSEVITGSVAWVSPAIDEATRSVPVHVALPNPDCRLPANTFGTADVIQRRDERAVVVPSEAVHWDGCCHVVFVRDRAFESSPYKVFHVRSVRPGAKTGTHTEIAAGLLPGEVVATTGSGVLRSELMKNNLGEG